MSALKKSRKEILMSVEFDIEFALSNLDHDTDIYAAVVDQYFISTPPMCNEMRTAAKSGDWETFRRHAHSIKSSSRTIGGMALGDLAEQIELDESTDLHHALEQVDMIEKCIHQLQVDANSAVAKL